MTVEKDENIEHKFLDNLIKEKSFVSIYLKNGIRLKGFLIAHTETILYLKDNKGVQTIFKNNVSTVHPNLNRMGDDSF